jgi:hypothetical protein
MTVMFKTSQSLDSKYTYASGNFASTRIIHLFNLFMHTYCDVR